MSNEQILAEKRKEMMKSLNCLYLAVEESIADDVNKNVKDYVNELETLQKLKT